MQDVVYIQKEKTTERKGKELMQEGEQGRREARAVPPCGGKPDEPGARYAAPPRQLREYGQLFVYKGRGRKHFPSDRTGRRRDEEEI